MTITVNSLAKKAACALMAGGMAVAFAPTVSGSAITSAFAAEDEYTYCYAGLSWDEYWASEGVYNATNTDSSDELDQKDESDLGGYDAVSRATTTHGLHRGSYQCNATIHTTAADGSTKDFTVSYWKDKTTFVTTSGETATFANGIVSTADKSTYTMTNYEVYGNKYVPVKVKTSDYEAFKADRAAKGFDVTENGSTIAGGFTENNLVAYSGVANVTATTYGIKTATLSGTTFSFSAANESATQTDSGIAGQALKTATTAKSIDATDGVYTLVAGSEEAIEDGISLGAYGEKIRVDLAANYGDLGANLQAVTWTYYGKDKTGTKAVRTYGTKFAADNWMHKVNHIQLGLTESKRFELPKGYDGTGYWTLTVHALGYKDYTTPVFKISAENLANFSAASKATKAKLQAQIDKAQSLIESNYTADSWSNLKDELDEAAELLANTKATETAVLEQITHVKSAISGLAYAEGIADNALTLKSKKVTFKAAKLKKSKKTANIKASVTSKGKISYSSSSKKVNVSKKGKVTVKKGTKKGTYTVTVTAAEVAGYKSAASKTFTVKVK